MSDDLTDFKKAPLPAYRRMLGCIPGARSGWYLGRALKDAWLDSSARAEHELKEDFSRTDPWYYKTNELEILRHRREAEMLDAVRGSSRFGRVLEVGCAEGVFTEILARRCNSLLATDISDVALARARQRCQWDERITFARLDLRVDLMPNVFDLILAIHVLEYIQNPFSLRRVRETLVSGLRAGGYLLIGSVSHNDVNEQAWWSRYLLRGGQRINAFIAAHPELSVVDSAINPLPGGVSHEILLRKIH
jgi:SAM-dependent methyltransferase